MHSSLKHFKPPAVRFLSCTSASHLIDREFFLHLVIASSLLLPLEVSFQIHHLLYCIWDNRLDIKVRRRRLSGLSLIYSTVGWRQLQYVAWMITVLNYLRWVTWVTSVRELLSMQWFSSTATLKKIWCSNCIVENNIRPSGTQALVLFFLHQRNLRYPEGTKGSTLLLLLQVT